MLIKIITFVFILLVVYGAYLSKHPEKRIKPKHNPSFAFSSEPKDLSFAPSSDWYWCVHYTVYGINPSTGRKKSAEVIESSVASNDEIGSRSGLVGPYDVVTSDRPATDAQLFRIERDKISIPSGQPLTIWDASIFITRSEESKKFQPPADSKYTDYAIEHQVFIPKYASNKEAISYLKTALPHLRNEINNL